MRRVVAIVALYALLACIALYQPLIAAPTHVPGAEITDYYHFHWNYWWMRHALENSLNIYWTDYVMYPFTSNLAYHTMTPVWFPLWAVLEPVFGTIHAMNGIFITAMTLNGAVFYAFLRAEQVMVGLSLVGGALVMLASMMWLGIYWTNINLINWFWLPGVVLLWRRIVQTRHMLWVGVLGVVLWAMALSDLQYAIFGAFFVVPYGVWTLIQNVRRGQLIVFGIGATLVALSLLWVAGPLPYLDDLNRDTLAPTPAERAHAVDFPLGWFWNTGYGGRDVSLGALILPLTAFALIVGRRTGRVTNADSLTPPRWLWMLVALPALLLTPGTQIPLIYDTLHTIFDGMYRYPERFTIIVKLALATVALRSLSPLVRESRLWRYALPPLLLMLVIVDSRLYASLPIWRILPSYTTYAEIGAEEGDYVVIEVPAGASSGEGIVGEREYSELQFYGVTHGKRMVNGHFSRVPIAHYWYLRTEDPLFAWLGARQPLDPVAAEARLAEIVPSYPVGYVMVHTDLINHFSGQVTVQEVLGYLNQMDAHLCPPRTEGDLVTYRTTWHPLGCDPRTPPRTDDGYRIDFGTMDDAAHVGWGWYFREEVVPGVDVRWIGAPHTTDPAAQFAQVLVDLPPQDYALTLSAQAFTEPVNLTVMVNGAEIDTVTVSPDGLQAYRVMLPAESLGAGEHIILTLHYDTLTDAGERDLAIMVDWLTFAPVR